MFCRRRRTCVDALQLEVAVAVVRARRVHAVLVGDDLPELGADLVAALAALDVNDFALVVQRSRGKNGRRVQG